LGKLENSMKRGSEIDSVGPPAPAAPGRVESAAGAAEGDRPGAAAALRPVIRALLGDDPGLRFSFWDGTSCGSAGDRAGAGRADHPGSGAGAAGNGARPTPTVRVLSPNAIRRLIWAPDQLGLGRAYVAGELWLPG
jgi:cyclopropane-fatty-acyl-phospholipid synthase